MAKKWRVSLEYICDDNNSLSPMAEVIARHSIYQVNASKWMEACSSGIELDELIRKCESENEKKKREKEMVELEMVKLALKNGLYPENWRRYQVEFRLSWFSTDLEFPLKYAQRIGSIFRDQVLLEAGLLAEGEYQKATVPDIGDEDYKIILAMNANQVKQVQRIYSRAKHKPTFITTLHDYAGAEGEIHDPFCQKLSAFREIRDYLLQIVPKTVERAKEEFIHK